MVPDILKMEVVWGIIALGMLIIELSTANLTTIWFAAAALVCIPFALYDTPLILQLGVFTFSSCIFLFSFKPLFKKMCHPNETRSMEGKICKVTKDADPVLDTGKAMIGDVEWTVKSGTSEVIKAGTIAQILRVEGVKLIIEPLEKET